MAPRDTYIASVASAAGTQAAAISAAQAAYIVQSNTTPTGGQFAGLFNTATNAANNTTVANAVKTKQAAIAAAIAAAVGPVSSAKDTLRASGDSGAF
jgi:hypothetical protein